MKFTNKYAVPVTVWNTHIIVIWWAFRTRRTKPKPRRPKSWSRTVPTMRATCSRDPASYPTLCPVHIRTTRRPSWPTTVPYRPIYRWSLLLERTELYVHLLLIIKHHQILQLLVWLSIRNIIWMPILRKRTRMLEFFSSFYLVIQDLTEI